MLNQTLGLGATAVQEAKKGQNAKENIQEVTEARRISDTRSVGNGLWLGLGRAPRDAENRGNESRRFKPCCSWPCMIANGTQETKVRCRDWANRNIEAWRLEPEGETEMPETGVVSDGVEGICVIQIGEGHFERGQIKKSRRQSDALGEEGEEIRSSKRKVIRVESEEAQDYVREAKDKDQEEAEELSFVPSAITVPRKPMFRCDNQCSEMTLSFWQLASVMIQEGVESHTTNFCQKCYNESLQAKENH